jgi:2-iminobutanoate/2-iminopropanoate deaminase
MTAIDRITTSDAPKPAGHYSQGCCFRDLVFVSGQLPVSLDGKVHPEATFDEQVRIALTNLIAIVRASGSSPDRVLKVTAFIIGVENWPAFNRVYAELFGEARPARSVVPVASLHHGCLVEIEAIAARET